ncbi:type IV toxin-antitoxin system AbiEi family antitoxin domain-containing protein [Isoptericola sp. BMS4]|uniref:type IV toxin-antitoxin system AbiEi family antitoxin domain-containing protein n=1 Tax=Isoptericola sp. BMS4 TaxID=2527875 RepID=UPI001421B206|nr:type IV toxin-antitoxin system AbiEi family antitoxin domain-containing protein [Isoptericola sp. BMS4]
MARPSQPVPSSLLQVARRQAGLVNLRQCHASGLTSRQVARRVDRGEWRRLARGVFDTTTVKPESDSARYDLRRRPTAFLGPLSLPGSILVGLGALVLHGVKGVPPSYRPEVTLPDATSRERTGPVRVRRLLVATPVVIDGVRCAPLAEALAQAVPTLGRLDAVAVLDSARHQGLLTDPECARSLTARRRGARRCWGWWDDADARAESPAESWARATCQDRGFPPDAVQLWVVGRGWRSRVDLAWVLPDGSVLLVEVDGRDVHATPDALYDDRHRP